MDGRQGPVVKLQSGDALRALAAGVVFVYHAAYFSRPAPTQPFQRNYGNFSGLLINHLDLGIYVFFVLSGYLISRPFVAALVEGRPLPSVPRYFTRRALRIIPAFWAIATALLLLYGALGATRGQVLAQYAFGQNYLPQPPRVYPIVGQAWTLDVEIIFYVLVPVAGFALARSAARAAHPPRGWQMIIRILAGCAVLGALSLILRELDQGSIGWQRAFPTMFVTFVPGIALAALELGVAQRVAAAGPRFTRRLFTAMIAAAAALAVIYCVLPPQVALPPRSGAVPALLEASVAGLLVAALTARQWGGLGPWRVLDNAPMRWLGRRSYSFYLLHQTVILQVATHWHGDYQAAKRRAITVGLVSFGITALLATAFYHLVELPFHEGWIARRVLRRTAPGGPAVPRPPLSLPAWLLRRAP